MSAKRAARKRDGHRITRDNVGVESTLCPVAGKVQYRSREDANKGAQRATVPVDVYRCTACRNYHLTSQRESEKPPHGAAPLSRARGDRVTYSTLKRGGPLKQRSDKRVKEDREYKPIHDAVLQRDGMCCQFPTNWDPWHSRDLVVHHIVSRARDKTLALEPSNLITLCDRHHRAVHDHPLEAEAIGLLKSAPVSPQRNQSR